MAKRRTPRPRVEELEGRTLPAVSLLKDINPGPGSSTSPPDGVVVNGTFFFAADDGTNGIELWKSDGTEAGTVLVKDIAPGAGASNIDSLTAVGDTLFFAAEDGTNGIELWTSDGTEAGTVMVKDINPGNASSSPAELTNVGGTLFFAADDGTNGRELWTSDGTEAGTVRVANINPGPDPSDPYELTNVGGTLFFTADDGTNGRELWTSDGTKAGTQRLGDIFPGPTNTAYPQSLTAVGDTLFFVADDGVNGRELWTSDGTKAGTVLVTDLQPGADGSYPLSPTDVNGTLYFIRNFNQGDGIQHNQLWKSDGTEAGTVLVKDITGGPTALHIAGDLTAVGDTVFFTAEDDEAGIELWKSDGTEAGTVRVADINPGTGDSTPSNLVNVGGTLFFSADDGTNGIELWKSDGTEAGTVLVEDINPGAGDSTPTQVADLGGDLLFSADDGTSGSELWISTATVVGPGPSIIEGGLGGSVAGTLEFAVVTFDRAIDVASFTEDDVTITGPGGVDIPATGVTLDDGTGGTRFSIAFEPRTAPGTYTIDIGPDVLDTDGNQMDQDGDGTNGEPTDTFTATSTIESTPGPRITEGVLGGSVEGTFEFAVVTFDRAINEASFTADDVSVTGPTGTAIPVTGVTLDDGTGGTRFSISFEPQTAGGIYTIEVGPDVLDADGNAMDQNDNGTNGEATDAFTTTGTLVGTPGPKVTEGVLGGSVAGTFEFAVVTFDRAINEASFTTDDVSVTGPTGTAIPVTGVTLDDGTGGTRFSISFEPQTAGGIYTIEVGPDVLDADGNAMDQNDNGTNGEATDAFTTTGTLVGTPGPKVTEGGFAGPAGTFEAAVVTFDRAMNADSFTADDVTITGPGGSAITVNGVTLDDGTDNRFSISFDPRTAAGTYTITVGPNVSDAAGNQMDQNDNGTNGEVGDTFTTTGTLASAAGPTVTSGLISGSAAGTFDAVVVEFSRAILENSFTADDVVITGPGGVNIPVTGVTLDAGTDNRFSIAFDPRTTPGAYTVTVGPNITDAAGNAMDQDGDGTNGEAADAFTTTRTLEGTTGPVVPLAVGASDGSVRIVDAATGNAVVSNFRPLDAGGTQYTGIVQVALGDLNADGVPDLLAAAANPAGAFGLDASKAGRVFVYDGAALLAGGTPTLIRTFTPFATTDGPAGNTAPYVNGLNIATADVDGNGTVDLIAGTRGGTATSGNREYGRVVVVTAGTDADGSDDSTIGSILKPFGNGYEKGVVVAGGDLDGDNKAEVAVTRGGPVASTNPNKTVKLKAYRLGNDGLNELNLSGQTDDAGNPRPLAPFAGITGANGSVIERDARVAFVDPEGDGTHVLVFTALDRITDPANPRVRVAAFAVDAGTGGATLVSTGGGATPSSYLTGTQVLDHAITGADPDRNGSTVLALVTESSSSGVQYLDPITGAALAGGFGLSILAGGITVDSF